MPPSPLGRTPSRDHVRRTTARLVCGCAARARGEGAYLVSGRRAHRRPSPHYRLSRLTSAELTTDIFTRPADFDLAAYWSQSQREFQATRPSYPIVLKVRDHAIRRFRPTAPILPTEDPAWWIVHADLENPDEAQAAVLAQAGAAQVIAPPELVTLVRNAAREIANTH
ncbi:helix-turn-helix transcriptional regulator [Kribbella sindirgiensis]|uniref:WYL domain-containing protein n=1 Tax=Kribbella sindirgiensis TaxID=1124744 RepID=A0A4R0J5I1_9ACTN|nr:WYL domain-containing protein [Kribbella sindirgiensis]